MTKIIFRLHDGTQIDVVAENGSSVMDAATKEFVPGILAECGGQCVCGTCHAYVDQERYGELSEPTELEQDLLEGSLDPRENSRLCCQVIVSDAMEGMCFDVPEKQY